MSSIQEEERRKVNRRQERPSDRFISNLTKTPLPLFWQVVVVAV